MTLRRAVFAALLLGAAAAAGLPAQAAFYPRSPQVTDLERLFRLAGRAFPVAGFPVSEQSLADWAAALAEDDPQSADAVERYLEGLAFEPGKLEIAIRSRFSLEGYLRTGAVWEDFTHEYLDREPLGELTLSMSLEGRAAVVVQAFLHREYFGLSDWNLPGSEAGNPLALENRHVTKGYLWYNFDPLQVEFGRDVVHFGPLRSSLLPSDRLPFMDLLRLTLPLGRLTMDLMISSLESIQAVEDMPAPMDYAFGKNVILANLHRFEYDFGFLRAAASALVVLAREDNFFVLADFFPVFSWHDADIKPNNMSLIFDLDAVLFPGFRVMGQFGFDDIKATIAGAGDSEIPTIFAGIVGVEYSRPLSFAGLDLYAEAGYTHYLWGSFHEVWYLERAIYRLELDGEAHALPLTSPYGPGTVWVNAEAGLEDWAGFTARLSGELVFRNPTVINLFTTVYESDPAVAGAALEGTLAVKGELRYQWKWLEAYAKPAFFTRASGGWLELALGATANLDWRRAVGKAAK